MSIPTTRREAALVVVAVALVATLVLRPGADDVRTAFERDFGAWWRSGAGEPSPDLQHLLDEWQRHQAVSATLTLALVVVLLALAGLAGGGRRRRGREDAAVAWPVAAGACAVAAWWSLVVHVQGVVAPLAALLPALVGPDRTDGLAGTLREVQQELDVAGGGAEGLRPPLHAMLDDYVVLHVVRVVGVTPLALALVAVGAVLWRRRPAGRGTRAGRAVALGCWLVSALLAVVDVANLMTVADPVPGLRGLFGGGW